MTSGTRNRAVPASSAGLKNDTLLAALRARAPGTQVGSEHDVERHAVDDAHVVDALAVAALADLFGEALDLGEIRLAQGLRVAQQFGHLLHALEQRHAFERELH